MSNLPIFRAKKIDSDEYVEGFLKNCTDTGLDILWIQDKDFIDYKIEFEFDEIFEKIWLWSELEKDFICIEPVLRDENWLIDNPIMINPLQTLEFWMKIKIKN